MNERKRPAPKGWLTGRPAASLCGVSYEAFLRIAPSVPLVAVPMPYGRRTAIWYRVGSLLRHRETIRTNRKGGGPQHWMRRRRDSGVDLPQSEAVLTIYRRGATMQEIATALGVTRQAILMRINTVDPDSSRRHDKLPQRTAHPYSVAGAN